MVFNWKRGPNPLTVGKEEAQENALAEALPLDLDETIEEIPEPTTANASPVLEIPEPAEEAPKRKAARPAKPEPPVSPDVRRAPEAPKPAAKPAPPPQPDAELSPELELLRARFAESRDAFEAKLQHELATLNGAFEKSLGSMVERLATLETENEKKDRKIAAKEEELVRLRAALKKVIGEAFAIVQDPDEGQS